MLSSVCLQRQELRNDSTVEKQSLENTKYESQPSATLAGSEPPWGLALSGPAGSVPSVSRFHCTCWHSFAVIHSCLLLGPLSVPARGERTLEHGAPVQSIPPKQAWPRSPPFVLTGLLAGDSVSQSRSTSSPGPAW